MRFRVNIKGVIDVPSEAAAKAAAKELEALMQNPAVKMILKGRGVAIVSATVDPPEKVG